MHRSFSGEIRLYQSMKHQWKKNRAQNSKNESKAVSSFCKENQGRYPGSWRRAVVWGAMVSSLPTKKMGMDPQCWVLAMLGWLTAQGTWHKIWPEVLVPGRRNTAVLICRAWGREQGWYKGTKLGLLTRRLPAKTVLAKFLVCWWHSWMASVLHFGPWSALWKSKQAVYEVAEHIQVNAQNVLSHSSRRHTEGSCGLSTSTTLTFHTDLSSLFFPYNIRIWSLLRKNAGKSAFSDHLSLKTDIISLEYSQGYWVSGRGNGWDLSVPFKPKPNTSPDFAQTIRKGNLAPGEDRVWSLYLARQPAISEWTYQMRYCVTKKVHGGVKCKSIPEPIEYKKH